MAGDSLAEQFKELEAASTSYAEHTTRLSHQIVAFENGLNSLAGKIPVEVADETLKLRVSFNRDRLGPWKLWFSNTPYEERFSLTKASIDTKIKSVEFFAVIVTEMIQGFSDRQSRVEQATEVVSQLVEQLHENGKGGA